jgi:hypothetical protein
LHFFSALSGFLSVFLSGRFYIRGKISEGKRAEKSFFQKRESLPSVSLKKNEKKRLCYEDKICCFRFPDRMSVFLPGKRPEGGYGSSDSRMAGERDSVSCRHSLHDGRQRNGLHTAVRRAVQDIDVRREWSIAVFCSTERTASYWLAILP